MHVGQVQSSCGVRGQCWVIFFYFTCVLCSRCLYSVNSLELEFKLNKIKFIFHYYISVPDEYSVSFA